MSEQDRKFDPAKATAFFTGRGHSGWLGLRYSDHGDDWVELELPWREDLLGEDGQRVLASGPILSLMDMASGMAIWRAMDEFTAIADLAGEDRSEEIVALDEALHRLKERRPRAAEVVTLRFFGGLSVDETADLLGVSPRTVDLDWAFARAWLFRTLAGDENGNPT